MSETNTGTVSKATLGKLLRDGMERIWAFLRAQIPSKTELSCQSSSSFFLPSFLPFSPISASLYKIRIVCSNKASDQTYTVRIRSTASSPIRLIDRVTG